MKTETIAPSWRRAQAKWYEPVYVGAMRLWYDNTNSVVRVKHGSDPTSESDGSPLMEG